MKQLFIILNLITILPISASLADSEDSGPTSTMVSEWIPSEASAITRTLAMIGYDTSKIAGAETVLSKSAVVTNVLDTTTPFLAATVSAARVFVVEMDVMWPPNPSGNGEEGLGRLYHMRCIVDSATGQLYEVRMKPAGSEQDFDIYNHRDTETSMSGQNNQKLLGFPSTPPGLSLRDVVGIDRRDGSIPHQSSSGVLRLIRYVLFQSNFLENPTAVWEIYTYSDPRCPVCYTRRVINANTGAVANNTSGIRLDR